MITTNELFSIIKHDGFFENVFNQEVDWDAELDARDAVEFDSAWILNLSITYGIPTCKGNSRMEAINERTSS